MGQAASRFARRLTSITALLFAIAALDELASGVPSSGAPDIERAVAFVAWLAAPVVWLAALCMIAVGATAAPLYPLASAQAYARRPGRAGVVIVASSLFAPLGLALPWLLGVVADHTSVTTALALLIAQPIGIVALALTTGGRGSRDSRTGDGP
jgi:fucose permease